MAGKFIVIDGSDGSGKGTQTELLIKRLKEEGKEVYKCDFPQYDAFFGKMVGSYLNNEFGDAVKVNPYLASLMYAGDRWSSKEKIENALKMGKIVIANRYVPSSMAHQGCKLEGEEREKYLVWLDQLEYENYKIPRPDKVIVLFMPADVSQKLVDKKAQRDYTQRKRDGHESNRNYLEKSALLYKELATQNDNWELVECVVNGKLLSIEEINDILYSLI